MYKNPKEFTDIEDMVNQSYIELSSHIPLRDSRRYKSSCMKYIKEVLDYDIKNIGRSEVFKLMKDKKNNLVSILNSIKLDYKDTKKEYIKVYNAIHEYSINRITQEGKDFVSIDSLVLKTMDDSNNKTHHRYNTINTYREIEYNLRNSLVKLKLEIRRIETTLKLLKRIRKELDYFNTVYRK